MALGNGRGGRSDPLYVIPMALALAAAAFVGAAAGLIWDSSGFGDNLPDEVVIKEAAPQN